MNPRSFFTELKRRNVYRAAVAYGVVAWFLTQLTTQVFPFFEIPNAAIRFVVIALALGFPIAMCLAWLYEFTPEGIVRSEDLDPAEVRSSRRATGRILDFIIIGVLLLVIAMLIYQRFPSRIETGETFPKKSIAVLPFENLSSDKENAYFADGITDSLTTDLSRVHSLRVISFQSVQRYKGERRKSLPEIARELNVDAVLEGSVQKSGDSILINAQLVQAPTDQHLWAERYTRNAHDLLNMQNEIVLAITKAIKVELTPQETTRFATARPVDPDAQAHYFLGRFHFGQGTEAGLRAAISEYEQAIAKAPNFAAGHAGIASCYSALSSFYMPPREAMPLAEKAAHKAIELDPDNAEAHAAIGYIDLFYHWNRTEAEREFRNAIELNPNYSTAYLNYGLSLLTESRFDEALKQLRNAQQLEPTSALVSLQIEWVLFLQGKYRDVFQQAKHTLSLEPRMALSYTQMGLAHLYMGEKEKALAELQKSVEMEDSSFPVTSYAYALAVCGRKADADKLLTEFLDRSKGRYICAYEIASAYEGMNERAKALDWLRRGLDEKCDCLVWGAIEPWMAQLRRDPRYQAILAKAGLLAEPSSLSTTR